MNTQANISHTFCPSVAGDKSTIWPLWFWQSFLSLLLLTHSERGRVSPGPVLGGHPHNGLLLHGAAVVRGCYSHLHRSHRLSENGDGDVRSWRTAQISGCQVRRHENFLYWCLWRWPDKVPLRQKTSLNQFHKIMDTFEMLIMMVFLHLLP